MQDLDDHRLLLLLSTVTTASRTGGASAPTASRTCEDAVTSWLLTIQM